MPSEGAGSVGSPFAEGLVSLEPAVFSFSLVCGESETFLDDLPFDRHDLLFLRRRAREDRRIPILVGWIKLRGGWWAGI